MVCSGNADAALQDDGHCSARRGGQVSSLVVRQAVVNTVMNGRTTIRTVMAAQAQQRE